MANRNVVDILIRARDEASRVLDEAKREIEQFERTSTTAGTNASSALKQIEDRATSLGSSLKGFGIVWSAAITAPLTALGAVGLRSTMQLETFQKSLNVLVGDAEKAKEVFDRLYEFDTETTFSWPSLSKATTLLAAFNVEAEEIVPTLGRLGDISAGVNMNIDELAEIFGKAKVQGRLFMEDVNQLTGRGIPVIQEFAKQFDVTEDAVRQLVSSGQVNFQHLERAIVSLTSEGGRFHNLMQEQGDTTAGRLLQLRKEFEQVTDLVGSAMIPMVDDLIGRARELVAWFVDLDESQQQQIVNIGLMVAAIGPLAVGLGSVATAVGKVAAAMRLLAGPGGAIALGVTAVVALVVAMAGHEGRRKDSLVAAMEDTAAAAALIEDPIARVGTSFDTLAGQLTGRALEAFASIRSELAALVAESSNAAEALLKIQLGTQLTSLFGTTFGNLNVRAALNAAGASMYGDSRIQGAEQQVTALLQRGQFDEAVQFLDTVITVLESGGHIASNALAEVNEFRQQVQNARELARTAFQPTPTPTPRVPLVYTPTNATGGSGGAGGVQTTVPTGTDSNPVVVTVKSNTGYGLPYAAQVGAVAGQAHLISSDTAAAQAIAAAAERDERIAGWLALMDVNAANQSEAVRIMLDTEQARREAAEREAEAQRREVDAATAQWGELQRQAIASAAALVADIPTAAERREELFAQALERWADSGTFSPGATVSGPLTSRQQAADLAADTVRRLVELYREGNAELAEIEAAVRMWTSVMPQSTAAINDLTDGVLQLAREADFAARGTRGAQDFDEFPYLPGWRDDLPALKRFADGKAIVPGAPRFGGRQPGDSSNFTRNTGITDAGYDPLAEEMAARSELVEHLTTISSDKGALGNFGAALFGLAVDKIPVLGAALDGFVQGGPVGAVVAVFTELLGQSEAFVEFIQAVNEALAPLAEMIGLILSPVLKALATVLGWVVDAIIGVYNFLLGWLFGRVERDKKDSEQTAPEHSNREPTLREVDYSSVGHGVQLAVATPILEAAQLSLLAANQQVVFADRLDSIYTRVETFYTRLFEHGISVTQPPAAAAAAGRSRAAIVRA